MNIWLEKSLEGLLCTITVGVFDTSTQSAFRRASAQVYSLLSLWTYQYKRPFSLFKKLSCLIRHIKHVGSSQSFAQKPFLSDSPRYPYRKTPPLGALFALFREGMNSTSFAYRFLSYFKIAEAWSKKKGPFAWIIQETKRKSFRPNFPVRTVTKEFLGGSYRSEYHNHFLNKKFTWCVDQLEEIRALIAHPFNKGSQFANLDSPHAQAHLGALANLIERIAIQLLEDFLEVWAQLDDSGTAEQVRNVYAHTDA